ncbi:MAG: polyphosphate kinase 2 family protein [Armatimonadetes bacterium]|nr:polyphosphate kinase 2 family protein [Armatimonadota bacterium]
MSYAKLVKPGSKVKMRDFDPSDTAGLSKDDGLEKIAKLGEKVSKLQELHYAAGGNPILIVLQGPDTAGKDGTIRSIMQFMNPQSTRVASFKVPTPIELAHDFLWRIHQQTPAKGESVIFNRSHYEDVLVVRVHEIVPKEVWKERYAIINAFEDALVKSGTIVLKFYLCISNDEQKERLIARQEDPTKAWKLSVGDWKERELWDDYMDAYDDLLEKCSTDEAPWRVVPANQKWFRNLAVLEAIHDALKSHEEEWKAKLDKIGEAAMAEIVEFQKTTD